MEIQIHRAAHAYQRHHAAYRNINAAGNHYKAHPAGSNNQCRLGIEYIEKGLRLQEPFSLKHYRPDIHGKEYDDCYRQQQIGIRHIFHSIAQSAAGFRCFIR